MDSPIEGEQQQHGENDGDHSSSNSVTSANMPFRKVYVAPINSKVRFDFVLPSAVDNSVSR